MSFDSDALFKSDAAINIPVHIIIIFFKIAVRIKA